jgi:hypothetical protein
MRSGGCRLYYPPVPKNRPFWKWSSLGKPDQNTSPVPLGLPAESPSPKNADGSWKSLRQERVIWPDRMHLSFTSGRELLTELGVIGQNSMTRSSETCP